MDVTAQFNWVFVSIKHIQKEKMPIPELEPMQFVSEEYCCQALTGSATPAAFKNNPFASSNPGSR